MRRRRSSPQAITGHAAAPPSRVMNSRRFTAHYLPCFPNDRNSIQDTAALRDFALLYVADGSIATDEVDVTRSRMSASPLKADNLHTISASPLSANRRHWVRYSITSSARTRNASEIVRPSAFAVLRLTASSNFSAV